ncbi:hypothetical protein EW145_g3655 [Phellinidium pouzarii]|uniref:non-specific serine/threonine protein kinase n=1 Tax=Phellinidium pouzarii TaxID=167371 RepID=A0A4S4L6J4_9AGAM|nr:hypothetical protein EW145_g3655 [Phellinidium pouzarii]
MSDRSLDGNELSPPASPASSLGALVVIPHNDEVDDFEQPAWRTILSDSHQVVLYNSDSHALSVLPHSSVPGTFGTCPYCHRPLNATPDVPTYFEHEQHSRASNYFQLLEIANETSSRPSSMGRSRLGSVEGSGESNPHSGTEHGQGFKANAMADGYFNAFFKEEYRLGMGANGSVFLCQHVLDGNPLGRFAVKKIAVGQSHTYLIQILREVRLLERLRHPNIITYHHSWLETHQFSTFGLKVPTLFVLMQWAEGGSLDDFIEGRCGRAHNFPDSGPPSGFSGLDMRSRSERIRAFRAARARPQEEREQRKAERTRGIRTAVHLLSAEETKCLFTDVVSGLAFLHDKSILHLDLKPGNVLLTWDEDVLIPRAMLSDFGTSRDRLQPSRSRSGNTGTLEYTAPESLPSPKTGLLLQVDSKADMWSLGMILHMLLFFRLPYHYSSDGDGRDNDGGDMNELEKEVQDYPGFRRTSSLSSLFESRGLSASYIVLLESLLNRLPKKRPSSEQVLRAIRKGNLDPLPMQAGTNTGEGTLIPRMSSPLAFTTSPGNNGVDSDAARFDEATPEKENHRLDEVDDLELETPFLSDVKENTYVPRPLLALPPSSSSPPLPETRCSELDGSYTAHIGTRLQVFAAHAQDLYSVFNLP